MDPIIKTAYEALLKDQSFATATIVENTLKGTPRKAGAKMIILSDGSIVGTVGGGISEKKVIEESLRSLKNRKAKLQTFCHYGYDGQPICGGKFTVFIEPFAGTRHLIICGGGHIALPLSLMAKMLNFKVTVIDNRKAWANKARFPHADLILVGNHAEKLAKIALNNNSFIMIATHGHTFDYDCLKKVVEKDSAYLAVIASQRKKMIFAKELKKAGVATKHIRKIKIPAGLDIGSQTPEEIAVAVAAEIISVYNKTFLKSAKFRSKH